MVQTSQKHDPSSSIVLLYHSTLNVTRGFYYSRPVTGYKISNIAPALFAHNNSIVLQSNVYSEQLE